MVASTPVMELGETMSRHLNLLGGFALTDRGEPVDLSGAARRLVAWLALRGRTQRTSVAALLWPDHPEARAMGNLRTAVWRANREAPRLVACHREWLALADDVEVDTAALEHLAHAEPGDPGSHELAVADGDLLPGWFDDWLVIDRERLRQLRLHLLEQRAAWLTEHGQLGLALEAALVALRADSLRESAHRAVIRAHLAAGNRADAYHAYQSCRSTLERELGVRPSPETTGLVSGLSAGRLVS